MTAHPFAPMQASDTVTIHRYRARVRARPVLIAGAIEHALRARGLPVWAIHDVHFGADAIDQTLVSAAAEALCYPWLGRSIPHTWPLSKSAVDEISRAPGEHDVPRANAVVRFEDGWLFVALVGPTKFRIEHGAQRPGPYVCASMESGRFVDAYKLQLGLWDPATAPDLLVVSPYVGARRELLRHAAEELYTEEQDRTGLVPRNLDVFGGSDAAVSALNIAAWVGRSSLVAAIDPEHRVSVAASVAPDLKAMLLGGEIRPRAGGDVWSQLNDLAERAGVELTTIERLAACSFEIGTQAALAGGMKGWSPAIEGPARGPSLGILAPLAAFATAMSWARRDAPRPVMWLHEDYGAVIRVAA